MRPVCSCARRTHIVVCKACDGTRVEPTGAKDEEAPTYGQASSIAAAVRADERATIVAWLRSHVCYERHGSGVHALADAIEREEHVK